MIETESLVLRKITPNDRGENKGSIAVAERLGLKQTGEFVKHYHGMDMVHIIFEGKKGEAL